MFDISFSLNPKTTVGWETRLQERFKVKSKLLWSSLPCLLHGNYLRDPQESYPASFFAPSDAGEMWPRLDQPLPAAELQTLPNPSHSPSLFLLPTPAHSSSELYTLLASQGHLTIPDLTSASSKLDYPTHPRPSHLLWATIYYPPGQTMIHYTARAWQNVSLPAPSALPRSIHFLNVVIEERIRY